MSGVSQTLRDGLAAAQAKQFDRARPLLQRVTIETPEDPIAWFWLAIVSPSADAAIPCLRRVLALDPTHEQAREAITKLLVTNARTLAAAGRRAEARAHAAEACQIAPGAASLWLTLVGISDDQIERIDALRRVMELTPEDAQIRTRLRQALLARGVMVAGTDRAEARTRFREAIALDPTDLRVRQALANLAESRGEWLEALRELLAAAPDHANAKLAFRNALLADARELTAAGQVDEACARLREAIARAGADVELLVALAATTPDAAEAERTTEEAFALDPNDQRAIAAMDRLRAARIDPATLQPPEDAFARFESTSADDSSEDPLAELESFDAFATLSDAPPDGRPAATPLVPSVETSAVIPPTPAAVEMKTYEPAPAQDAPVALEEAPVLAAPAVQPDADPADAFSIPAGLTAEPFVPPSAFDLSSPPDLQGLDDLIAASPSPSAEPPIEVSLDPGPAAPGQAAKGHEEPVELNLSERAQPAVGAAGDAGPGAAKTDAAVPAQAAPAAGPHTVMVVDDSPTIRKILGLTLERAGYRVVAEADGEAAIARLHEVVPDLILLDIAMPKIDGYEVCKRIKKNARTARVPVVMLSGKDAFFDKVKGHMAGASEYLTKPFEAPAVLAVVTTYCKKSTEVVHG